MCVRMLEVVFVFFIVIVLVESLDCPIKTGLARCLKRCPSKRMQPDRSCTKGRVCCLKKLTRPKEISKLDKEENRFENLRGTSSERPSYGKKRLPKKPSVEHNKPSKKPDISDLTYEIIYPVINSQANLMDYTDYNQQDESQGNYINGNTPKNLTNIHEKPGEVVKAPKWFNSKQTKKTSRLINGTNTAVQQQVTNSSKYPQPNSFNYTALNGLIYFSNKSTKANRSSTTAVQKLFDCGDAEDRLRCRRNCPARRQVPERTCPFNRICCRGKPSSIYSPLRQAPFYPNTQANVDTLNSEDQVFNYLINRYNVSDPIRIISIDETNDIIPPSHRPNINIVSNDFEDNNIIPETQARKSIRYCKKYQELTVEYLHAMPLLPEFLPFTLPMDNCLPRFIPLIVGGKNVTRGEFPHMAAVGYHRNDYIEYLCGGTLISEKFVLTAAHCAETRWGSPITVMLGSVELYSEDGVEIGVKRTITHPDYKPPSYYHDIALIELGKEATFTQFLRPACLALPGTEAQEPGSVAIATGWGKTGFARPSTMHLMKVPLKILQNEKCEEYYASDIRQPALQEGINDKLICATGHESEYHDTCQGDSGGPLQAFLPGHNCMLEVVAVTSFGKTCGTAIPGVYTKIEPYIDWIENIVWP